MEIERRMIGAGSGVYDVYTRASKAEREERPSFAAVHGERYVSFRRCAAS
jgi:hypothetical protein